MSPQPGGDRVTKDAQILLFGVSPSPIGSPGVQVELDGSRRAGDMRRAHAHIQFRALEVLAHRLAAAGEMARQKSLGDGHERETVFRHGKTVAEVLLAGMKKVDAA